MTPRYSLLLILVAIAAGAQSLRGDAFEMAMAPDVPGKYVYGACLPFAEGLQERLLRARVESHLLVYNWREGRTQGTHSIVVYRDDAKRYWAMDNEHSKPVWISGSTPQEWCRAFAQCDVAVTSHRSGARTSSIIAVARNRNVPERNPVVPMVAPPDRKQERKRDVEAHAFCDALSFSRPALADPFREW